MKMSVNGVSAIFGPVSRVIVTQFGFDYTYWMYCHPLSAKKKATHSLPHLENERQQSINDFKSC